VVCLLKPTGLGGATTRVVLATRLVQEVSTLYAYEYHDYYSLLYYRIIILLASIMHNMHTLYIYIRARNTYVIFITYSLIILLL